MFGLTLNEFLGLKCKKSKHIIQLGRIKASESVSRGTEKRAYEGPAFAQLVPQVFC